jgi:CRP/FNR family cyclic AMP-dependent transcriptional regulator
MLADRLREVQLLADLGPSALEALARDLRLLSIPKGHLVVSHQDPSHDVYLVLDGRLRVTVISSHGREVSFRELGPGASFGEIAALDGAPRSASVEALAPSRLAVIPHQRFLGLLRSEPAVALALLRSLARLVRDLSDRVYEMSLPVPTRICLELLRHQIGGPSRLGKPRRPPPSQTEIGNRVGSNREAVSRLVRDLTRRGLASGHWSRLVIHDPNALFAFAMELAAPREVRRRASRRTAR